MAGVSLLVYHHGMPARRHTWHFSTSAVEVELPYTRVAVEGDNNHDFLPGTVQVLLPNFLVGSKNEANRSNHLESMNKYQRNSGIQYLSI